MNDHQNIQFLEYYGNSVAGRRTENQDHFLCRRLNHHTYCFAVADGMGGSNHGAVASKLVIEDTELFLVNKLSEMEDAPDLKLILKDCFHFINERFIEFIAENPDHAGMGTTLVVLLISHERYAWANIGDSRIYGISEDQIEQISEDHTYIQN